MAWMSGSDSCPGAKNINNNNTSANLVYIRMLYIIFLNNSNFNFF